MATEIISAGFNEAASEDITNSTEGQVTIVMVDYDAEAVVRIELKYSDNEYVSIGELSSRSEIAATISVAGTFRARRQAGGNCRVFREP